VPSIPAFVFGQWPLGSQLISYPGFADAAFALIMLVNLLADRRIPRRWLMLGGTGLLLLGILLALGSFLLT
jgi:hypothetical protein